MASEVGRCVGVCVTVCAYVYVYLCACLFHGHVWEGMYVCVCVGVWVCVRANR